MKKIIIKLLIIGSILQSKAQNNNIDKFQGYWIGQISSDPKSNVIFYEIVKNKNKISLTYENGMLTNIIKSFIGFNSLKKEAVTFSDLHESGKYLYDCVEANGLLNNCTIIEDFDSDGTSYWYGNTDVYDFNKIAMLPESVLKDIFDWGKKGENNFFLKTILDITVIKSQRSTIHNIRSKPSKSYLIKGDVVEILQIKDQWLKIRYYGKKTIEGWIKKSDVENP